MNIVIVEDDPALRDAIEPLFFESGHEATLYQSGYDLFFNGFDFPDMFVIDWRLRGMSGMEICRRLTSDPLTKYIPVYIMTAADHAEEEARAAGAVGVLRKPLRKGALSELLKKIKDNPIET